MLWMRDIPTAAGFLFLAVVREVRAAHQPGHHEQHALVRGKPGQVGRHHIVLALPFLERDERDPLFGRKASIAVTKAWLIGAIEHRGRKLVAAMFAKERRHPRSYCNGRTWTFRDMRSLLSISSVVCSSRTWRTVRGKVMVGSGRWRSLADLLPARRADERRRVYRIPLSHGRSSSYSFQPNNPVLVF
jgi:hypothetical protein